MPINCEFHLSRVSAVYYTGEQVSGFVTLIAGKKQLHLEGEFNWQMFLLCLHATDKTR